MSTTVNQLTKRLRLLVLLVFCAGIMLQCKHRPHYQADISGEHIAPIRINRYEKVLFSLNPANLREEIDPYLETYDIFLGEEIDNPVAQKSLYDYITDPLIVELYHETMEVWDDLTGLEKALTTAFRYYSHHFPDMAVPKIFSYISGLEYTMPIKYAEGHLIFALDLYLGREFPKYRQIGIPLYQTIRMDPDYLLVDIMQILGEKHIQETGFVPETFLDYMIYEGKLHYFLDCMLPEVHDSLKIGYTSNQLEWMQQNRGYVWSFYLENEFLYASDRQTISRFIGDAPFTSAFSRDSAPRTAAWIGWQIVREYMRRHPEVGLQALFRNTDARQILTESRYRGR
jgi:hypothetical protein